MLKETQILVLTKQLLRSERQISIFQGFAPGSIPGRCNYIIIIIMY